MVCCRLHCEVYLGHRALSMSLSVEIPSSCGGTNPSIQSLSALCRHQTIVPGEARSRLSSFAVPGWTPSVSSDRFCRSEPSPWRWPLGRPCTSGGSTTLCIPRWGTITAHEVICPPLPVPWRRIPVPLCQNTTIPGSCTHVLLSTDNGLIPQFRVHQPRPRTPAG